jgi:hypothetical protein
MAEKLLVLAIQGKPIMLLGASSNDNFFNGQKEYGFLI